MNICVIGTGYVGLVTGTCLVEIGNDVLCLDVDEDEDEDEIALLKSGGIPIYDLGLENMVKRGCGSLALCYRRGAVQFIAVGTPMDEDGSADLQYPVAGARNIGKYMDGYTVVVDKSTVPAGTADNVRAAVKEGLDKRSSKLEFNFVSNPEFSRKVRMPWPSSPSGKCFPQSRPSLRNRFFFDGRNLFEPKKVRDYGIEYHSKGRR